MLTVRGTSTFGMLGRFVSKLMVPLTGCVNRFGSFTSISY